MAATSTAKATKGTKHQSMDLVRMRDVLEELASRKDRSALLDVVFGVLQQAEAVIENQAVEIEQLRKQLFGRRSEKVSPNQLSLFARVLGAMAEQHAEQGPEKAAEPQRENKKKKRRSKRRDLKPTQRHEILVPAEERPCPQCGQARCTLGHERSLVIEYTPPKIDVIEYLREKVVCRACEAEITLAPQPAERLIDRALPGPQILAALTVHKGVDGLPLNRTHKIFARSGLDIPIQTLNRWEGFAHQLLEPVIGAIHKAVLGADTINLDDTGLRVRDPTLDPGILGGHIWVFVARKYDPGGDLKKTQELVFYSYAPTWEAKYPEQFLQGCPAVLQGDAYRGYERIADPNRGDAVHKLLAGCCMHARRPFVQALEAKDPAAIFFVERFQALYRVETEARAQGLTAGQRLELRKQDSLPILQQLKARARELQPLPLAKPMKTGVTYLLNQWDKLLVPFTHDGRLEIDNGSAERRLRRVASGRKSWFFAGSQGGAERLAGILSLVSSAEAAGVDPGSYIADILPRLESWPHRRLDELLPHRWRALIEQRAK
ncbi:MAG: IS66 family transposase [Proteobacteria bacterium]|nr:IS66 family transposase [Pseudomonadota bacterium]